MAIQLLFTVFLLLKSAWSVSAQDALVKATPKLMFSQMQLSWFNRIKHFLTNACH